MTAATDSFNAPTSRPSRWEPKRATTLGEGLLWAFRNERHDLLEFIARVNRRGLRIFRFRVAEDGRYFYVLIDTDTVTLVTVMPPGFKTPREGGGKIALREMDG